MTTVLSISSIVLIGLSVLYGRYEVKKGQIKMRDNEIPIEEVIFEEDYNIHELF